MTPFDILLEALKQYDEILLCELLDISSEDIVDMFMERIKQRRAFITKELELLNPEDPQGDDGDDLGEDEDE